VTKHEFIFSDQRRHRVARHVVFWIVWWFTYTLLFHIPTLELKGWGFSKEAAPATFSDIAQIGPALYIIKTLIFNSLLASVAPQAIFTYILMYWILPQRFYKKRNAFVTVIILIGVLFLYYLAASLAKHFSAIGSYILGLTKNLPTVKYTLTVGGWSALREQLGSLPILAGFAVMIKLIKRWWLNQKETEQLAREKTKAELQLLKAQIHPHFLFNTLNNIYYFTLTNSSRAPEMIKKLSGMLYYILNECKQNFVPLDKEIRMIQDYMALEKIRYGDQMKMTVEIQEDHHSKLIAPLLLIPFVENSFKHGTSKMLAYPYVKLSITTDNDWLYFFIRNSRPSIQDPVTSKGNIGLRNVKKRLELLYPRTHEMNIVSESESFTVYLKIRLSEIAAPSLTEVEIKPVPEYAMA
jgi:sensor histidine kinase YesM